jgi:hypothetical protein
MSQQPGRSCPIHYRYSPRQLARVPDIRAETLYVVGGLYGNLAALKTILDCKDDEEIPVTLVFNGDFNWFNVDAAGFETINEHVLQHTALRGNVETEMASSSGELGCGCGYPDWVDDATVHSSNTIMERLSDSAAGFPELCQRVAALPMHLVAAVGGVRIGIVHGDAESLAGWSFAQESLASVADSGKLEQIFRDANVRVFSSTHTGLAVCESFDLPQGECVVINSGTAGMPNFRDTHFGVFTRISTKPATNPLYGARLEDVYVDAIPVHYDQSAWRDAFVANWPPGSSAYTSYFDRIRSGPDYTLRQAMRGKTSQKRQ